MELQYLPTDALINVMIDLDSEEISRLCRTNAGINAKCKSEEFIRGLLGRKYNIYKLNIIPGATLQEKYDHVMKLLEDSKTKDIKDMKLIRETEEMENRHFGVILKDAVRLKSKTFLETIIYNLLTRIDINSRYMYLPSFGPAFFLALKLGNTDILNVLLQYYVPREQLGFNIFGRHVLEKGDLKTFKKMLPYIDITTDDFGVAIAHNQYELADFVREQLSAQGNDPLSDQDIVDEMYVFAITDGDKPTIKYLMEQGVRFDPNTSYVSDNLATISPEMIAYLREIGLLR